MSKSDWVIPSVWWAWYLIQAEKLNEAQKVLDRARTLLTKDTVERLFYLDVLAGLYYARKDYRNFVATVKKQLPLSQNSEELRALKVRLNDGLKLMKGEPVTKPGSCGALAPGDTGGAACGKK